MATITTEHIEFVVRPIKDKRVIEDLWGIFNRYEDEIEELEYICSSILAVLDAQTMPTLLAAVSDPLGKKVDVTRFRGEKL